MKFPSLKGVKLLLLAILLVIISCKKEVVEINVDAFAQLNNEVKTNQGMYTILFTLQPYPYKEVSLKLAKSKESFHKNTNLTSFTANQVSENRYGVFVNNLNANETYYYQILVKDSSSSKEVSTDVFSFKTNP